jgi:hypothetical protein
MEELLVKYFSSFIGICNNIIIRAYRSNGSSIELEVPISRQRVIQARSQVFEMEKTLLVLNRAWRQVQYGGA